MKIQVDENDLAAVLNIWFNNVNTNDSHFWKRNKVAKILKDQLKSWGYWKNRVGSQSGRRKAHRKMQWVLARRNGYEGEFEG